MLGMRIVFKFVSDSSHFEAVSTLRNIVQYLLTLSVHAPESYCSHFLGVGGCGVCVCLSVTVIFPKALLIFIVQQ